MTTVGITADHDVVSFADVARRWWVFLLIGTAWIIFSVTVFRFDWRTVSAISILFGVIMIATALEELVFAFATTGTRWVSLGHVFVGVVYLAIGVVAFIHPGNTFAALAGVMSFYFVIAGVFRMMLAFFERENAAIAFSFLVGLVQVLVGFWAAGDFGRRTVLLVVWVGVAAISRGMSAFIFGFALREAGQVPALPTATASR